MENFTQQRTIEDYLKSIYALEEEQSPVSTSRIAAAREVKPASATSMVQRLDRLGLVSYQKHQGVRLTEAGRGIALQMLRHHRLLELYLTEVLGFEWHEVHEEAERLEHVISEKLEERIAAALDQPSLDPHGAPIPTKEGVIPPRSLLPITGIHGGGTAVVAQVTGDSDPELLCYLADLGLKPGARLTVLETAPYEGPITLDINGRQQILGHKAAAAVYVSPE